MITNSIIGSIGQWSITFFHPPSVGPDGLWIIMDILWIYARTTSINLEVQDESGFEDKIFTLSGDTTEIDSTKLDLTKLQGEDAIISDAVEQLKETGSVSSGKLQEVSRSLAIVNGMLYRDRAVVPLVPEERYWVWFMGQVTLARSELISPEKELLPVPYGQGCAVLVPKLSRMSEGEGTKLGESTYPRIQDGRDWTRRPCSYGHRHSPLGRQKFRYFVCIIDVFTRYMELIPLQDQSAVSLAREFQCGWIFRGHGVPKGLLTDQAHNIDGVEIRALCERLGIEKRHSSLYHPQGDGLVERNIGLASSPRSHGLRSYLKSRFIVTTLRIRQQSSLPSVL